MSMNCRKTLAGLRKRYAHVFNIPIEDVEDVELEDDVGEVFSSKHPELPCWTTGECP